MSKYMWCSDEFHLWIKNEIEKLRRMGLTSIGTEGTTKILVEKVFIPNNLSLTEILKPYIKIKNGRKIICEIIQQ